MSNKVEKRGLIPKLRFPEFREAGEWEEKTIGQISENVTAGGTPSTSEKEYWGGSIRWMNSGELNYKKVYEVQGRITEKGLRNSSTKIIPKMCVLIGLAGQGKTRGTVAMNMVELCINQSIAAIFPNDGSFHSDFLYHNLDNRYDELRSLSTGGEGRGGLNLQIIKSLVVPLPKLKEQQKIADCLTSLDERITLEAQKLDTLKTHKKGLMQQLFPAEGETLPKLRFPEFRDAGEWVVDELGTVAVFVNEKIPVGQVALENYVSTENILQDFAGVAHASKLPTMGAVTRFRPLDTLVSNIRPYLKKVWVADKEGGASNDVIVIRAKQRLLPQYFSFLLKNDAFIDYVMTGAKGVKMPRGDIGSMKEYPAPYPTKPEQQKIADCLATLDDLITAQTQKLTALKTHKKGLMQQLFPNMEDLKL